VAYNCSDLIGNISGEALHRNQVTLTKQIRFNWCFRSRAVLVHDTGFVKVLVAFPAFAVGATGKRSKVEPTKGQGIGISVPRKTSDLFRRLFYAAGIVPSNGGAEQLSQRGNAELFFRSGVGHSSRLAAVSKIIIFGACIRIEFTLCMEWPASDGNPLGQRCCATSAEQQIVPRKAFL
jgi:hypothetical protein